VEITEIRIKLMEEPGERLRAFCSITFDGAFVIRDLKIIEGTNGPFVAMPSRKLTARCPQCRAKNHLRALYCNQCGLKLKNDRAPRDEDGRSKLYADIAHPINSGCREMIQERLVAAYHDEVTRSKLPGYVPSYFDYDNEEFVVSADESFAGSAPSDTRRARPEGNSDARPSRPASAPAAPSPDTAPPVKSDAEKSAAPSDSHGHPRGPHKPPVRDASPARTRPDSSGFGAGILE
jgi:stage V sporulation protein G